jgi:flagellar basal body-associated protein FliL
MGIKNINDKSSNRQLKAEKEAKQLRKTLFIFLVIVTVLAGTGGYFHLYSDQSNKNTESFFESRKNPGAYYEHKEANKSAKERAESNIYLQN